MLLALGREAAVLGDALRQGRGLQDDELALPDLDRGARAADEALPRRGLRAQRALVRSADAEAHDQEGRRRDDDHRRRDRPRLRGSGRTHPEQDNPGTGTASA